MRRRFSRNGAARRRKIGIGGRLWAVLKVIGRIWLILSVLLLVGTVGMWVRSHWRFDYLGVAKTLERPGEFWSGWSGVSVWSSGIFCGRSRRQYFPDDPQQAILLTADLTAVRGFVSKSVAREDWMVFKAEGRWGFDWHCGNEISGCGFVRLHSTVNGHKYAGESSRTSLFVPWWFLVSMFSVAPGFAAWRMFWSRRLRPGCCMGCGYDLRATPEAGGPVLGVCPECGRRG